MRCTFCRLLLRDGSRGSKEFTSTTAATNSVSANSDATQMTKKYFHLLVKSVSKLQQIKSHFIAYIRRQSQQLQLQLALDFKFNFFSSRSIRNLIEMLTFLLAAAAPVAKD